MSRRLGCKPSPRNVLTVVTASVRTSLKDGDEGGHVAELFTEDELKEIEDRAYQLSREQDDPGLRDALQLLAEAARNVAPKLPRVGGSQS
jgi:hypothetical protein